jgi:hypothetical protein
VRAQSCHRSVLDAYQGQEIEKIIETIPEWEGLLRIATYLSLMAVRKENHISSRTGALASYTLIKDELMEEHFSKIIQAFKSNEWYVYYTNFTILAYRTQVQSRLGHPRIHPCPRCIILHGPGGYALYYISPGEREIPKLLDLALLQ